MNKILTLIALIAIQSHYSQVGINTQTPNNASVLDITSTTKGILIPRLTSSERDTNLADNDITTVPPAGVANPDLTPGTLIFNTDENRFEFWDGVVWRQLFVATHSQAGNDGVVKIIGGNAGALPSISLTGSGNSFGTQQQVLYTTPLTFAASPTTSWPETTVPFPGSTSNIYIGTTPATQRWIENNVEGQIHVWRLIAKVTSGNNSSGSVMAIFTNPDSGFVVNSISSLPSGSSSGNILTFYFYTVADPDSLAPGKGYQLFLEADTSCTIQIQSFTRISLFKD